MIQMIQTNKLEFLAAKLYCLWTAGNCPSPSDIDAIIKDIGKEVAERPYVARQEKEDSPKFIAVDRADLMYVYTALVEAQWTPQDELLPDSVTRAEALLKDLLFATEEQPKD